MFNNLKTLLKLLNLYKKVPFYFKFHLTIRFLICPFLSLESFISPDARIVELGCGSGQNIMLLSHLYPHKKIIGLDWSKASIKIANLIGNTFNKNVNGFLFDMMNPSPEPSIENHSVIFSIHSLEQLGKNHSELLCFLLRQKPALVLHYEPILELYDEKNLYDFLAIMYSKKRDYLSGYLTALRKIAQTGEIEIITEHRPYIGGIFHEASLITWRPLLKNGVRNDQR